MSSEAIGWTFRHAPYTGSAFQVLLAVADSVNDQNENELWMSMANLARKARTERRTAGRAVARMLEDDLLELIEERPGGTNLYRFLFPDLPVVFETRKRKVGREAAGGGSTEPTRVGRGDPGGGSSEPTNPSTNPSVEPKPEPSTSVAVAPDPEAPMPSAVVRLCELLADLIGENTKQRPTIGKKWYVEMDRLIRIDKHLPGEVERVIRWAQADPFWLSNILSPAKLRKQYTRLSLRMRQDEGQGPRPKTVLPSQGAFEAVYGPILGGDSESGRDSTGPRGDAGSVAAPAAGSGADRSVARVPVEQAPAGPGDGDGEAAVEDAEVLPDDR